ncbi:hypothetical protein H0G86_006343 [Trichoderma simmonsii]|uniref:Uncharacterized protein n=1 Tax=Trichoderma simmonsii TaxID=1491479 RepID=A0A8G0PFB0_9HYPO|nr:hypothetical protein H0G86_006343 [Trichoderma simmonsii]
MKIEPGREPLDPLTEAWLEGSAHHLLRLYSYTLWMPDRPPKKHGYAYGTATSQHLDANPDRMPCIGGQSKPCRGVIGSEARVGMARFSSADLAQATGQGQEEEKIEREAIS